jgi:hypothetical protein
MADIRQNPVALDLFDYGNVLDYLTVFNSNWVSHVAGGLAAGLTYRPVGAGEGHATARYPTDRRAFSYWSPLLLDGDDQEVWARERGGTGSGKSWRLSLTKDPVFAGISGYSFTITVGTGGGSWFIRRYDADATGTIIASGTPGAPTAEPRYCLLRRSGSFLQAFRAGSGGTDTNNWTQIYNVFDETYMTGLYPTLWVADDAHQNHGYDEFGGGPAAEERRTRIIRWITN